MIIKDEWCDQCMTYLDHNRQSHVATMKVQVTDHIHVNLCEHCFKEWKD